MSVFGVILVCIFPHLDWIRRESISLYSVRMQENGDQNNPRIRTVFTQWRSTSYEKINVLTGKLLVIRNQVVDCELNSSRNNFLRDISYLALVKLRHFVKFTFAYLFCPIIYFCSIILKVKFKLFVKFTFAQLVGYFQGENILKIF